MVFSSANFLFLFMPLALAICIIAPRQAFLPAVTIFSIAFYYWSSGPYIVVLLAVAAFAYCGGLQLDRADQKRWRDWTLAMFATLILSFLFFFKYAGFVSHNADLAFSTHLARIFGNTPLPIGISFFTFQALSYLIDVYRRDIAPERKPVSLTAYLMFFPHLVAGPIVRYRDVVEDFLDPKISADHFAAGVTRFAHGLAKKVLIADSAAPIVDAIFSMPSGEANLVTAWFGAIAYGLQIYFDFSGYSDMAIGLALMLGIRFRENFERPYVSCSITEFWRRWHISLSSWFRDYVYFPLGGSRYGVTLTCRNILFVFVITGLWHGAAWTLLLWGLYHGTFMLIERLAFGNPREVLRQHALRYAYALPVILFGWVMFRSVTVSQALDLWGAMANPLANGALDLNQIARLGTWQNMLGILVGSLIFVLPGKTSFGLRLMRAPTVGRVAWLNTGYAIASFAIAGLVSLTGSYSPFLYFRF